MGAGIWKKSSARLRQLSTACALSRQTSGHSLSVFNCLPKNDTNKSVHGSRHENTEHGEARCEDQREVSDFFGTDAEGVREDAADASGGRADADPDFLDTSADARELVGAL